MNHRMVKTLSSGVLTVHMLFCGSPARAESKPINGARQYDSAEIEKLLCTSGLSFCDGIVFDLRRNQSGNIVQAYISKGDFTYCVKIENGVGVRVLGSARDGVPFFDDTGTEVARLLHDDSSYLKKLSINGVILDDIEKFSIDYECMYFAVQRNGGIEIRTVHAPDRQILRLDAKDMILDKIFTNRSEIYVAARASDASGNYYAAKVFKVVGTNYDLIEIRRNQPRPSPFSVQDMDTNSGMLFLEDRGDDDLYGMGALSHVCTYNIESALLDCSHLSKSGFLIQSNWDLLLVKPR
jgi:hypothetical protein